MAVDIAKLQFSSNDPLDKIVEEGTVVIVNSGITSDYAAARIVTETKANTYGSKLYARFVWKIDSGDYNSQDTRFRYSYTITTTPPGVTSSPYPGLKAAVAIAVSNSLITFQTANGDHGNVVSNDGGITYIYTPTTHTFTVKYALFEVF